MRAVPGDRLGVRPASEEVGEAPVVVAPVKPVVEKAPGSTVTEPVAVEGTKTNEPAPVEVKPKRSLLGNLVAAVAPAAAPAPAPAAGSFKVNPPAGLSKSSREAEFNTGSAAAKVKSEYKLPSLNLLGQGEAFPFEQLAAKAEKTRAVIEKTFTEFGLNVKVTEADTGPVVTQFELELEPGLRVSKVQALADDLAIALRVPSVRIVSPIPGKNTVGVEVPNDKRVMVRLREIMEAVGAGQREVRDPDLPRQGRERPASGRRHGEDAAPADRGPHRHGQERVPQHADPVDAADADAGRSEDADDRPEDTWNNGPISPPTRTTRGGGPSSWMIALPWASWPVTMRRIGLSVMAWLPWRRAGGTAGRARRVVLRFGFARQRPLGRRPRHGARIVVAEAREPVRVEARTGDPEPDPRQRRRRAPTSPHRDTTRSRRAAHRPLRAGTRASAARSRGWPVRRRRRRSSFAG